MGSEDTFKCVFCKESFSDKEALQIHFRKHGDPNFNTKPRKVSQREEPSSSEKSSPTKSVELISCDVCAEVFPTTSKAITHKHKVHPDHDAKYFCNWCGKLFTMKYLHQKHLASHDSLQQGDEVWHCDCCDVDFYLISALMYHNRLFHRQDTELPDIGQSKKQKLVGQELMILYYCPFCGEEYINKVNLHKHMADDHGDENQQPEEVLRCPLCDAIFYHLDAYEIHLTLHTPDDIYNGVEDPSKGEVTEFTLDAVPPLVEKVEPADAPVAVEQLLEMADNEDSNMSEKRKKHKKHKKHKKSKKEAITLDEFLNMNQDVFGECLDFQGIEEVPTQVVAKALRKTKNPSVKSIAAAGLNKLKQQGIVVKKMPANKQVLKLSDGSPLVVKRATTPNEVLQKLNTKDNPVQSKELTTTNNEVISKLLNQSQSQLVISKAPKQDDQNDVKKVCSSPVINVFENQKPKENVEVECDPFRTSSELSAEDAIYPTKPDSDKIEGNKYPEEAVTFAESSEEFRTKQESTNVNYLEENGRFDNKVQDTAGEIDQRAEKILESNNLKIVDPMSELKNKISHLITKPVSKRLSSTTEMHKQMDSRNESTKIIATNIEEDIAISKTSTKVLEASESPSNTAKSTLDVLKNLGITVKSPANTKCNAENTKDMSSDEEHVMSDPDCDEESDLNQEVDPTSDTSNNAMNTVKDFRLVTVKSQEKQSQPQHNNKIEDKDESSNPNQIIMEPLNESKNMAINILKNFDHITIKSQPKLKVENNKSLNILSTEHSDEECAKDNAVAIAKQTKERNVNRGSSKHHLDTLKNLGYITVKSQTQTKLNIQNKHDSSLSDEPSYSDSEWDNENNISDSMPVEKNANKSNTKKPTDALKKLNQVTIKFPLVSHTKINIKEKQKSAPNKEVNSDPEHDIEEDLETFTLPQKTIHALKSKLEDNALKNLGQHITIKSSKPNVQTTVSDDEHCEEQVESDGDHPVGNMKLEKPRKPGLLKQNIIEKKPAVPSALKNLGQQITIKQANSPKPHVSPTIPYESSEEINFSKVTQLKNFKSSEGIAKMASKISMKSQVIQSRSSENQFENSTFVKTESRTNTIQSNEIRTPSVTNKMLKDDMHSLDAFKKLGSQMSIKSLKQPQPNKSIPKKGICEETEIFNIDDSDSDDIGNNVSSTSRNVRIASTATKTVDQKNPMRVANTQMTVKKPGIPVNIQRTQSDPDQSDPDHGDHYDENEDFHEDFDDDEPLSNSNITVSNAAQKVMSKNNISVLNKPSTSKEIVLYNPNKKPCNNKIVNYQQFKESTENEKEFCDNDFDEDSGGEGPSTNNHRNKNIETVKIKQFINPNKDVNKSLREFNMATDESEQDSDNLDDNFATGNENQTILNKLKTFNQNLSIKQTTPITQVKSAKSVQNISKNVTMKSVNSVQQTANKPNSMKRASSQAFHEDFEDDHQEEPSTHKQTKVSEEDDDAVPQYNKVVRQTVERPIAIKNQQLSSNNVVNQQVTTSVKTIQTKTVVEEITTTVTRTIKTVNQTINKEISSFGSQIVSNVNPSNIRPIMASPRMQGVRFRGHVGGTAIRQFPPVNRPRMRQPAPVRLINTPGLPTQVVRHPRVNQPGPLRTPMTVRHTAPSTSQSKPLKIAPNATTNIKVKPAPEETPGPFSCFKKSKESLIPDCDGMSVASTSQVNRKNFSNTAMFKSNVMSTKTQMKSETSVSSQQMSKVNSISGMTVVKSSSQSKQVNTVEKCEMSASKRTALDAIERLQRQGLLVKKPRIEEVIEDPPTNSDDDGDPPSSPHLAIEGGS